MAAENRLALKQRTKDIASDGVPQPLATRVAGLFALSSALDIVEVAKVAKRDMPFVAILYFALGARLELQWLREQIATLKVWNHGHALAQSGLRYDLHIQHNEAVELAKRFGGESTPRFVNGVLGSVAAAASSNHLVKK